VPEPIKVDIPHRLGREAAKARLEGGIGKLATLFPSGATVEHRWEGDTLQFTARAMGQTVASRLDVFDSHVHAEVDLPPMLALLGGRVRDQLMQIGPKLLK
jgi:Putative polyhydroxyalkanoic acid system protein (PHA_gran_rgn)